MKLQRLSSPCAVSEILFVMIGMNTPKTQRKLTLTTNITHKPQQSSAKVHQDTEFNFMIIHQPHVEQSVNKRVVMYIKEGKRSRPPDGVLH